MFISSFFSLSFSLLPHPQPVEVPGQGLNLCYSSDQSHSGDNTGALTLQAIRELPSLCFKLNTSNQVYTSISYKSSQHKLVLLILLNSGGC